MKLIQDNKIKEEYSFLKMYDNSYKVYIEDIYVGFSALSLNSKDMVFIYVDPEYRGSGYGKKMFSMMTKLLENINIKEIDLLFDTNNIQMNKIINSYSSYEIVKSKDVVSYKIKNNESFLFLICKIIIKNIIRL